MRKNDSPELKIIRVFLPLLIYLGVRMIVEFGFAAYAAWLKMTQIGESDSAHYILAYNFLDNTEEYLQNHVLVILFISGLITLFLLFFVDKQEKNRKNVNEWHFIDEKNMMLLCLLGVCTAGGLGRLVHTVCDLFSSTDGGYAVVYETFQNNPEIFQLLTLCIVAPITEEVVFRGMMYRRLKEYVDITAAVLLDALFFGIFHGNLIQGVYAVLLGILLCFVREKCRSMIAPVLLHMSCNTIAFVMSYSSISRVIDENPLIKIFVTVVELVGIFLCAYLVNEESEKKEMEIKNDV